ARALARIAVDHDGARVLAVAHGTLIRHALGELSGHEAQSYPRLDNLSFSRLERADASWRVLTVGGSSFDEVLPWLRPARAGDEGLGRTA
ncbi:histidine phosphatase family protein, partial [Agromyces binzhouensis]